MTEPRQQLLSSRGLARNVGWSLLGTALPLGVGVWAIPRLMDRLGTERFGLLTLIWVAVGYLSLFDLGFGRALTKLVAQRLGDGREDEIGALTTTGIKTLGAMGVIVGGVLAVSAQWLVSEVLSVPASLRGEAAGSLLVTGATLPLVMTSSGLVGVLQAHQRFAALSVVQAGLGVAAFAAPLVALRFNGSLVAIALFLGCSRAVGWMAYRWLCRDLLSRRSVPLRHSYSIGADLIRFGGWVTVSNLVGPIMVYSDRFLIAGLVTMTAVAYYTTPYEMITRLWVVADALVAVIFPALATALPRDPPRARWLFVRSTRMMTVIMLAPTGLVVLFARDVLTMWLGAEFARMSSAVLQWLAVGVFVNAVARLPFSVLQASGRPDVTAKLHLIELPAYLFALWALVRAFGIEGAAAAWTLRAGVDAVVLFGFGLRYVPDVYEAGLPLIAYAAGGLLLLVAFTFVDGAWPKAIGAVLLGGAAAYLFIHDLRTVLASPAPVAAS